MTANGFTLLVLAKAPMAGRSKTRLAPRYGMGGAARLAAAALGDTLVVGAQVAAGHRALVLDGRLELSSMRETCHLATGFEIRPQADGDHAERIIAAFEATPAAAVLIGMDTPQVTAADLALDLDDAVDAWWGPAQDGGWWALGLRHAARDARRVIAGVPMSTGETGARQRERLIAAGLRVRDLPLMCDVDTPQDALQVAASAPHTRFARCLAELERARPGGVRPDRPRLLSGAST